MLMGLRAPSLKKCRSSVETTALMTTGGTWLSETATRFCSENEARMWALGVVHEGGLRSAGLGAGERDPRQQVQPEWR